MRTISVSGGNLFDIALRELGDARAAWRIAAANQMIDFWITGQVELKIPDPDPNAVNDGLPALSLVLPVTQQGGA
jgi:hypothetical protein